MIREVDAVPAIALVLDPHRAVLRHVGPDSAIVFGGWNVCVGVHALVALGRDEIGMHGFVREVQEVGLLLGQCESQSSA